ncbi:MAG: glycosyltransferase [Hyphomicrobiaceae bacterium]|nr:glycosyltransferase [Hyphomicrobiaceae bacterium]
MMHRPKRLQAATRGATRKRAPFACRLVVMAKLPIAGRVKTRLGREIGTGAATGFYRATARAVLARLGGQPFWETLIAISPDTGVASPMLPAGIDRIAQGSGDLGARMHRPMRLLPPGPVCVVGTDVPAIRASDVRRAFRALGRADAVFGPAEDGGFWLVGFRRRPRVVWPYDKVGWSRSDTLAAVVANLGSFEVALTTRHSDVDSRADLERFHGTYGRVVRA